MNRRRIPQPGPVIRADLAESAAGSPPSTSTSTRSIVEGSWHRITNGIPVAVDTLPISERAALALSTVYACITRIATDLATLSLNEYARTESGLRREDRAAAYELLAIEPNEEMDAFHWHQTSQIQVLGWGNHYSEIETTNGGTPARLWPLSPDPHQVGAARSPLTQRLHYEINGRRDSVAPSSILHLAGPSLDGITGLPVLRLHRESLALDRDTRALGRQFFSQGMLNRGVIEVPQTLSPDAYSRLKTHYDEKSGGGLEQAHKPLLLEGGATYKASMIAPQEAQFLETREFQALEIARIFSVPPHKIGIESAAPRANVEESNLNYVMMTISGWVRMRESAVNRRIFTRADRRSRFVEYNLTSFLRGNMAARSAFYREMWSLGALTTNEIRRRENLDPIGPEGDTPIAPANMSSLKALAAAPTIPAPTGRGVSFAGNRAMMPALDLDQVDQVDDDQDQHDSPPSPEDEAPDPCTPPPPSTPEN